MNRDHSITDYEYFSSAIGDALHSGLTKEEITSCMELAYNASSLNAAIAAQVKLKDILSGKKIRLRKKT